MMKSNILMRYWRLMQKITMFGFTENIYVKNLVYMIQNYSEHWNIYKKIFKITQYGPIDIFYMKILKILILK